MARREAPKQNRLPKDFNAQNPNDIEITDPPGAERQAEGLPIDREYPKHLHKFVSHGMPYEYVVVDDAAGEKDARADGFQDAHAVDADVKAGKHKASGAAGETPSAQKPAKSKAKAKK